MWEGIRHCGWVGEEKKGEESEKNVVRWREKGGERGGKCKGSLKRGEEWIKELWKIGFLAVFDFLVSGLLYGIEVPVLSRNSLI